MLNACVVGSNPTHALMKKRKGCDNVATLKPALTPDEVKKTGVSEIRKKYNDLAINYNKMLDRELLMCPQCGEFLKSDAFYLDRRYATEKYPICKKCLLKIVEQRKTDRDEPHETKESVQRVLQMMNKVYDDDFYENCVKGAYDEVKEKNRSSPWSTYITAISSLSQYRDKTWDDSYFGENYTVEEDSLKRVRKEIKKIFGHGFSDNDYVFLQDQYDDFKARTQVDSKSQEVYVIQICLSLLDIDKDRKAGKDVTNKLKALDILMNAANLQPKQNVANAATDSLTFGQLIEKWEQEKPIPEPSEEFKDVDGIGKYIRVWFTGWLSKAMGFNNSLAEECEEEWNKYRVIKSTYEEEDSSDDIYDKLFGKEGS